MRTCIAILAATLIGCGGIAVIDPDGASSSSTGASSSSASSSSSSTTGGGGSAADCMFTGSSSLPGARIEFPPQRCTYTLAEAAAGIAIVHRVIIDQVIDNVIPRTPDAGNCAVPTASGLILFEDLGGDGQRYCLCDVGLCPPPPGAPTQLQPGSYDTSFVWDGVNWAGPSDTGNPKGPPFPPGNYQLDVSAQGTHNGTDFDVKSTFPLTLVP
jgi:hypothetical protein